MNKTAILFLVSVMVTSAWATINPDPNEIGVYFDGAAANVNCITYGGSPVTASVVITNPTASTIDGIEFGFRIDSYGMEGSMFIVPQPPEGIDVGETNPNNTQGDVIFGFAAPMTVEPGENIVLYSWNIVLFGDFVVDFFLSSTSVSGAALPRYVINGSEFVSTYLATGGGPDTRVASINGDCPVAVEESSFGRVKSLFR